MIDQINHVAIADADGGDDDVFDCNALLLDPAKWANITLTFMPSLYDV